MVHRILGGVLLLTLWVSAAGAGGLPDKAVGSFIEVGPNMSCVFTARKPITRAAVADPKIADVQILTANQVLVVGQKKPGVTTLIVWYGDQETDVRRIRVRLPDFVWEEIRTTIDRIVPDAHVKVERLGEDGVALDGTVESQADFERVVAVTKGFVTEFTNMVTVRGLQQVQLEVKVAEVSRTGLKQMGLGFLLSGDNSNIAVTSSGAVEATQAALGSSSSGIINEKAVTSTATLTPPFGSAFKVLVHQLGSNQLLLLNLLKSQGLSRLLASPTLVAMNGQKAEFLVGGEFPYPYTTEEKSTSIQFKEFGISLSFTPYIVDKETITLIVAPEVSALDYSVQTVTAGTSVPGITTRRAQSTVQLKDGQVFAIAGLLRQETNASVNKVPFLGDIPFLGSLFTNKSFENRETELVIVVCPRIVTALNKADTPLLPGALMEREMGDFDFFLRNRVLPKEGPANAGTSGSAPRFRGEIGYSW
jgi:pilus assembly protein CpaC